MSTGKFSGKFNYVTYEPNLYVGLWKLHLFDMLKVHLIPDLSNIVMQYVIKMK